jgi:hypothetical protein
MALSGQKTVTSAGTAEALGSALNNGPLVVKALDTNTGKIYLGNDGSGSVSSANGLILLASEIAVFDWVASLASIMVNATVNGEGVSWMRLEA